MNRLIPFLLTCVPSLLVLGADPLPTIVDPPRLFWLDGGSPPAEPIVWEREFALEAAPAFARVKIAATDGCELSVNGQAIPLNGQAKEPQAVEVPNQLVAGTNKVRIQAKGGSVVMSLTITHHNGTRRRLETNDAWQVVNASGEKLQPAKQGNRYGAGPRGDLFASLRPSISPADQITVPAGFQVELLHGLDDEEGSWVAICTDPKGRLIASDAGGGLVRITPPAIGGDPRDTKVEPIDLPVGHANGLLWAFDSLYVMVCQEGVYGTGSGVYRVRDTNGDDVLDSVELLRKIHGSGDHGPHALLLSPDGQSITVVCGNSTKLTEIQHHQVPPIWQDDLTLPKMTGHGFMLGAGAPAGYIARMSPDGKTWTLAATGFRNQYDAAYNRDGELFTYDADMEWDLEMPWYRPTRVCHVVDGAEYGWRSVSGKWPEYYADSLPPVINIGRGSPTGVAFGYGAKFPSRYQEALFICDWTYGKLYAVHMKETGATYAARQEVFLEGRAVKPTDLVIGADGAMYLCGGSRRSNSALYRISYVGTENVTAAPPPADPQAQSLRALRHQLEQAYHANDDASLSLALENLSHPDRFIRFAARTLLEFRAVDTWRERALALSEPRAIVQVALALARLQQKGTKDAVLNRLATLPLAKLDDETKLQAIRALQLASIRLGDPEGEQRDKLLGLLHRSLPAPDERFNTETSQVLVRWKSPLAAKLIYPLFDRAASQEDQMAFAASLRFVAGDWPSGAKEKYFRWFLLEKFHKAGHLAKFIADMRKDAIATLTEAEKVRLKPILDAAPEIRPEPPLASRLFVRAWGTDELFSEVKSLLAAPRNVPRGRQLFRETGCAACHLFRGEGGVTGPDLTLAANKFAPRELVEHIVEPSKVVSDQYAATMIETTDGAVISGKLVLSDADKVQVQPNLYVPSEVREIARQDIAHLEPSKVSLMPVGLVNTCHPDEVADLVAWIQSGLKAARVAPPSPPIPGVPAPIAHWMLDDDDGEARDSAGKHHGMVIGAAPHAGKIGSGLLFDRARGQRVEIPFSPDFQLSTFTVSAWVWLTKEPAFSGVLGTRQGGEFNFDLKVNVDKVHGDIGNGERWLHTGINFYKGDTGRDGQGGDLALQRWYLITYVIDGENHECRMYLDADLKKKVSFPGTPSLMRPGQTLTIGDTGNSEFMDGVIDDVRIWEHALTDEQVRKLLP